MLRCTTPTPIVTAVESSWNSGVMTMGKEPEVRIGSGADDAMGCLVLVAMLMFVSVVVFALVNLL